MFNQLSFEHVSNGFWGGVSGFVFLVGGRNQRTMYVARAVRATSSAATGEPFAVVNGNSSKRATGRQGMSKIVPYRRILSVARRHIMIYW